MAHFKTLITLLALALGSQANAKITVPQQIQLLQLESQLLESQATLSFERTLKQEDASSQTAEQAFLLYDKSLDNTAHNHERAAELERQHAESMERAAERERREAKLLWQEAATLAQSENDRGAAANAILKDLQNSNIPDPELEAILAGILKSVEEDKTTAQNDIVNADADEKSAVQLLQNAKDARALADQLSPKPLKP